MPPLAEPPEGRSRAGQLLLVEGDDLDVPPCQELVQVVARVVTLAPFEDHRGLEHRRRRHQASVGLFDATGQCRALRFVEQDGENRRGIEGHRPVRTHVGRPTAVVEENWMHDVQFSWYLLPACRP